MASRYQLRTVASFVTTLYSIYVLTTAPAIRQAFLKAFSYKTHPFRLLALVSTILLNAKSLPLMWHFRLFGTMLYHLYLPSRPLPKDALFRPVIMSGGYTSFPECDHNLHKSNSTYFADLDLGRTLLVTVLLRKGIREASARGKRRDKPKETGVILTDTPSSSAASSKEDEISAKGQYLIALGGVSCTFKREIKPYERFEIWTRVLTWDRKWIYLISHIVKEGAVMPDEWALQPLRDLRPNAKKGGDMATRRTEKGRERVDQEEVRKQWHKAVFATSVAKYVVKKGRLTISPEVVFARSDLLPPRPGEDVDSGAQRERTAAAGDWTWGFVESERLRGLKLLDSFRTDNGLLEEFPMSVVMMGGQVAKEDNEFANGDVGEDGEGRADARPLEDQIPFRLRVLGQFRDLGMGL